MNGVDESDRFGRSSGLSTPERFAQYAAAHASGIGWAAVQLCVAAAFVVASKGQLWPLSVVLVLFAWQSWERMGVKRLLARRDAEIARLHSGGESA